MEGNKQEKFARADKLMLVAGESKMDKLRKVEKEE